MAAIAITGSVGEKPKPGDKNFNTIENIKKIQSLINSVFGTKMIGAPELNKKCGPKTIAAIMSFQKLFPGTADGNIWPGGTTLRRLNAMATPLRLKSVKPEHIKYAGYEILYETEILKKDKWPKDYKVFLELEHSTSKGNIDVTNRVVNAPNKDLITKDNMVDLLKLIEKIKAYPATNASNCLKVGVRLIVKHKIHEVTKSGPEPSKKLTVPLKPYSGGLGKDMLKKDNLKDYKYSGNKTGRMLHIPAIDGKYYFKYNNLFENNI